MAKVIVERPRGGWRIKDPKGERRRQKQFALEDQPKRESTSRRWSGGTKHLSEHLGPLRRFLLSNVGRPWNKVFSEICENISRNSAVQDHVRDHVGDFVETQVILLNGVPCSGEPRRFGRPLGSERWRRAELYVCPKTGILKRVKIRRQAEAKEEITCIPLENDRQYRLIKEIWYEVVVSWVDGEEVFLAKRQLNKREIARRVKPHLSR